MNGKALMVPITVAVFLVALWGLNLGQNVSSVLYSPVGTQSGGGQVKEFTLREYSYELQPSTIQVNKGDVVSIMFITTDTPHGYILDGYNVKTGIIASGGHETIKFTADKTGTFYFHDYTGKARVDIGPLGKLIVTS